MVAFCSLKKGLSLFTLKVLFSTSFCGVLSTDGIPGFLSKGLIFVNGLKSLGILLKLNGFLLTANVTIFLGLAPYTL